MAGKLDGSRLSKLERSAAQVLVAACVLLASLAASAAPIGSTASRAELASWLEGLRARGVDPGAAQSWQYAFSAADTASLERLSLELVAEGYAIATLTGASGGAELLVVRTELVSPRVLERRNRELAVRASAHRVRYDGLDLAARSLR